MDVFECDANSQWHEAETCENGCDAGECLDENPEEEGGPLTGFFLDSASAFMYGIIVMIILGLLYLLWRRPGPFSTEK
jgi:hypothetical protein